MKKILSTIVTVVVLIGAFLFINEDNGNNEFDVKGIINKLTTGSIENTKEDKELIGEKTNRENYIYINNNKTSLSDNDKDLIQKNGDSEFWADYPKLDKYGRAGKVTALVTYDSVMSHSSKAKHLYMWQVNIKMENLMRAIKRGEVIYPIIKFYS
ncbi:hypothetical protein [Staphylococcus cohnii]|uniref:hypothetical protein n=1 Tax=Staphylococcus cohnii TaxID=29382 RepID=UPI003CEF930F